MANENLDIQAPTGKKGNPRASRARSAREKEQAIYKAEIKQAVHRAVAAQCTAFPDLAKLIVNMVVEKDGI